MSMKRHHPALLLFNMWWLVKNLFFVVLYLFVIKHESQSMFIHYGRYVVMGVVVVSVVYIVFRWLTQTYMLDETSFHLHEGLFTKSKRTVPFTKIQNVNRHTSLFHRLFHVTSIRFETGVAGEDTEVEFKVIGRSEADRMEEMVRDRDRLRDNDDVMFDTKEEETVQSNRLIHFQPTKKELLKASFTSLSFLAIIPLVGSLYSNVNDFFHVDGQVEGLLTEIMSSWFILTIIVILLVILAVAFGVIRTILTYGRYEISSDEDRIYIKKGIIEETSFSISKQNVQAIQILQSPIKKILGLAEVKLTSVGIGVEEDGQVNSLYPFLPVQRAYDLVSELLPHYKVTQEMNSLPIKALWIRLMRPHWIWMIAAVSLAFLQPAILGIAKGWIWLLVFSLLVLSLLRVLDFFRTRYTLHGPFIQFKTGRFTTTLFVSNRDKIVEVAIERSMYQKLFGLASIKTVNRENPVHYNNLDDIPSEVAESFYEWYMERRKNR
ncbi:PH domain-containing protein [Bacillus sp. CGMCC 1.16541]|uniref:PH domain-containing protein n=1 Tax=Bacillus sp. CGMCC 1.16541 TaxID=2185143 RepID=UPI0031BAE995